MTEDHPSVRTKQPALEAFERLSYASCAIDCLPETTLMHPGRLSAWVDLLQA